MRDRRQFRKEGERLLLGGVEYLLGPVEGSGGSCVVYQASYEDQLNRGALHQVLIKELYPLHPKGLIARNEAGDIFCEGDGNAWMERCRESFYQGNQANLSLLLRLPEKTCKNLNSYEAYGTFYSVLAVHGGRNLEELLSEGGAFRSLKQIGEAMLQILDAVEGFHQNGILHLDISPDNILMLPGRALLIDYNSVWQMDGGEENPFFSVKEGYTAPEVLLKEAWDVGPASDLYSVCAVLFRMLTGRRLSDSELRGRGLQRCFPKSLEIFRGVPVSAAVKAVWIAAKGLDVLAGKRYQSVEELRTDVRELLCRIEGKGVTPATVWEGSRKNRKQYRFSGEEYYERRLAADDGRPFSRAECEEALRQGGLLLLKGPGGMGKTRLLTELWRQATETFIPGRPVTVYIPLAGYQEAGQENRYIRKYLLRFLCFQEPEDQLEDGIHELERLMEQPDGLRLILLLDGLNEAGSHRSGLLKEIEGLGAKPGVGILITDRLASAGAYGLRGFCPVKLLPLTEQEVQRKLEQAGTACPAEREVLELLRNPMMLSLYRKTAALSAADGESGQEEAPLTVKSLVGRYLEGLCVHELRIDSGNQAEQLRHQYILRHFLPEIAGELKRRRKTLLGQEALCGLAEKSFQRLSQKSFSLAFPEFLGKSRVMFQGIADGREWFDYAAAEQLTGRLGLLEQGGDGNFRLIHENFLEYLAEEDKRNRRRIAGFRRKEQSRKGAAGIALAAVLAVSGGFFWNTFCTPGLTERQQNALDNALKQMEINLSVLGSQIYAQNEILKEASSAGVLEGKEKELQRLEEWMEHQSGNAERALYLRGERKDIIKPLEDLEVFVPSHVLQDLYVRTYEMDGIMENGLEHLKWGLCGSDTPYVGREKREPLVRVYEAYLDAYTAYISLELNCLLIRLDEENRREVRRTISETAVFQQAILDYPISGAAEEEAEGRLKQAEENLKSAVREMESWNYSVPGP